ncbi:hypothetical protein Acid345_1668 [Candidatus Koribacter versatilis Ellin345]|uniref:Right handed beta helix domain-containing protein n=1 Tax=Koribacter versatilis (strain Ellin345) TaxID=204669 RepID=Q1IR31_KORVE|nr:hypothetical protein Acid345_1668 [Candidatus Koribacter versatilis Ellin345]
MRQYRFALVVFVLSSFLFNAPHLFGSRRTASDVIHLSPGDDIQAAVNANPAGTSFVLSAGEYRLQSIRPKDNDSFQGEGLVVLNGSQVLPAEPATTYTGQSLWKVRATPNRVQYGQCQSVAPLCGYTQDLFVRGVLMAPAPYLIFLTPRSFYFDRNTHQIFFVRAQSSSVHAALFVELATRNYAFYGSAKGVRIANLVVEKYANEAQKGAIGGDRSGSGWTLDNVEVRWNHGAGVELGPRSTLQNSKIHHNGQLGVAMSGPDCLVRNNEIAWNNYAHFDPNWEAGGSKFWATSNLEVDSNDVHDNEGPGLWTDTDNIHTVYENNRVIHNSVTGIVHEVSYDATIRNNLVKENGYGKNNWMWGAQITIQNSSNVEVYLNQVEVAPGYGNGIAVINQNRGTGAYGPRVASNNTVHFNVVVYHGSAGTTGFADDTGTAAATQNAFDNNIYVTPNCAGVHWRWLSGKYWTDFQGLGQELNGSCQN